MTPIRSNLPLFVLVLILTGCRSEPLPVLGQLPPFALTDQTGRPFGRADLADSVWVVNFIFTRCTEICPRLSAKMARLRDRVDPDRPVRFLSISVDPGYDSPEVLAEYGQRYAARPPRWLFLTGDAEEVKRAVVDGFHLPIEEQEAMGGAFAVLHSEKFVLVDGGGRIRGYYDSDSESSQRLLADLRRAEP